MTLDGFVLWKFKKIEGRLKNFYSSDFLVTKYKKNDKKDIKFATLRYDLDSLTVTISSDIDEYPPVKVSFKDIEQTLKDMDMYEEKEPSECHSSALIPWGGKLEI